MTADRLDSIFGDVQAAVAPLLARVLAAKVEPTKAPLTGE